MSLLSRIEVVRGRRLYFFFLFSSWRGTVCYAGGPWAYMGCYCWNLATSEVSRQLQAPSNCLANLAKGATVCEVKSKAKAFTLTVAHPAHSMGFT